MKGYTGVKFFLGANTPYGFYSYYDKLCNPASINEVYILKGGPGTGKSRFMKDLAAAFGKCDIEFIHCSSDPDSLDGVIIEDIGVAVIDGTAPHTLDPKYPGVVEKIINLADFIDTDKIKNYRIEIISRCAVKSMYFENAYRYLRAAGDIISDTAATVAGGLQTLRLQKLTKRIIKNEITQTNRHGESIKRFLSGITSKGIITYFETASKMRKVYKLCDDYRIAPVMLREISCAAQAAGHKVYECLSPIDPSGGPEHLIIPSLSLAFVTSNRFHTYEGDYIRSLNLNRYIDHDVIKKYRSRLRFNHKAAQSLIDEAVSSIATANEIHDKIESRYINSMDFQKIDALRNKLIIDLSNKYLNK